MLSGLAAALASSTARADEAQELELGKNRFDAGQYEDAARRFTTMLDPSVAPCDKSAPKKSGRCRLTDKSLIERARTFAAASLIALKRVSEADAHIEAIFRQNPNFAPNPALFPPEVIDRFTEVKARIRAELEEIARKEAEVAWQKQVAQQKTDEDQKRWLDEIQLLAGQERVVEKNSRFIAAIPFGVGQFQNGDNGLGWFFAVSEALTGSASIALSTVVSYYASVNPKESDAAGEEVDLPALNSTLSTAATLNHVAFGAWAALAVAGIVHAQITFVPERSTIVKRPIPKRPELLVVPTVSVVPGKVSFGLVGRF